MVLGIVRLLCDRIRDGCGVVEPGARRVALRGAVETVRVAGGEGPEPWSGQTDSKSRRAVLSIRFTNQGHGGPRDACAATTGSTRRVRDPQASHFVRSRPIRARRVVAVIGIGGLDDALTMPK